MVAFAPLTFSLSGCADDSYLYDEDIEDYYSDYDSEGMDDFYDSMPRDEDYYEGGSYGYGGQYYRVAIFNVLLRSLAKIISATAGIIVA